MKTINEFLNEAKSEFVRKGIFSEQGKKVQGEKMAKWTLSAVDKEDFVIDLTWKEYKSLNLPDNLTEYSSNGFITALATQLRNFGLKIEFNGFMRKNPSFEESVDWLLKNGCKYTKKGIKHK